MLCLYLKFQKIYQEIYDLFKKGKYSEFPNDYKVIIFKFHDITWTMSIELQKFYLNIQILGEEWEDRTRCRYS